MGFNNYIPNRLNTSIISIFQLGMIGLILVYLTEKSKERIK